MEVKESLGVAEVQVGYSAHGNTGQRNTHDQRMIYTSWSWGGGAFNRDIIDFGDHSWSSETGKS